ncbi:MAG: hypothetical protein FWC17_02975 [Treponema sp.]|nr:hypothetical protein [Treponema sp.]
MYKKIVLIIIAGIFVNGQVWTQDFGFGFGFDDVDSGGSSGGFLNSLSVSIGGEVSAAVIGYFDEMIKGADSIVTRDMFMFSGKLNFLAKSSLAQAVINLKLVPALVPVSIDEAYLNVFYGGFDISAGLKKVAWGKADQFGPLDVINMPDASKIFIEMADNTSLMGVKIANPMIHASFRFGQFSKIEGIFLPNFEIVSMAVSSMFDGSSEFLSLVSSPVSDKWIPASMNKLYDNDGNLLMPFKKTDTSGLDYAQAGLRFTTTIGSADIGIQYFYGRMFQPAAKFNLPKNQIPDMNDLGNPDNYPSFEFLFNIYHQAGLDYAQVIAGFNIRAEVAANITEDLKGDDGLVYNPSIGWSFGFDRNLFAGINLNVQGNGTVRLFNDKIGSSGEPFDQYYNLNPNYDVEYDTSMTSTRITAMLSRKFMRDELELRAAVVWGIEDMDFAIIPALIWTRDELRAAFSGGFFIGERDGQLGQYKYNNFLKLSVTYIF